MNRTKYAKYASALWITIFIAMIISDWKCALEMPLNEWGDTLAGFFSPLAFLWLVVGYLQQGEELKVSSKALQLQAEELRRSVEQQQQLVEVTRKDVDLTREVIERQRERESAQALPEFRGSIPSSNATSSGTILEVVIRNIGSAASDVRYSSPSGTVNPQYSAFLQHNEKVSLQITVHGNQNTGELRVDFIDALRRSGAVTLMYANIRSLKPIISLPEIIDSGNAA